MAPSRAAKRAFVLLLAAAWAAGTVSGCSTGRARESQAHSGPDPVRPKPGAPIPGAPMGAAEQQELKEIQAIFSQGAYESVIARSGIFEKRFPRSGQLPVVRNLHGLAFLLTKRPSLAVPWFRSSIDSASSPEFKPYVRYNLAAAQYEAGQLEEAAASGREILPETLDRDTRIKLHTLRARVAQKLGRGGEAAREILAQSRLVDAPAARASLGVQLEEAMKTAAPESDALYTDFEDSPIADILLYHLGQKELAAGSVEGASSRFRTLISRFPESSRHADATEALRAIQARYVVDPGTIGLLLPMKGRYARFGQKSLQGAQLAFRIFNPDEPPTSVTVAIEDSGEDAETALRGLNNLYTKHHAAAVIGPLLSKGLDQVAQRAQELGVPLVTLAQTPAPSLDYVVSGGLSPAMQAREVARYAVERLNLKRFAILHPRDKFGEQYAQSFWDAVEELGGKVTGIESYVPGETDFRQPVDRLSGLYYTEARARELDALAKSREEQNIKKRTRKTEQFFSLPPVVDYEAVFIADEPKALGQILPTFAYRDVEKIRFLGVATWNSPEFLKRAGAYAEGAVFADAFFPGSASSAAKKFSARYRSTFNQEPGALEALSYDAAAVIEQMLAESGTALSRADIRDRLKSVSGFPGVSGKIAYKDGQLTRGLHVLTVREGKIVEAR